MEYREIIESCYRGDATAKLALSQRLAARYRKGLSCETHLIDQVQGLQEKVGQLEDHMVAMGLGRTCAGCAATPGGGCCSAYMGNENPDTLLLLMNILAGVEVVLVCGNGEECAFLGESGCVLLVKPIFCLNYLCSRIRAEAQGQDLTVLERWSGTVLTAQSVLEQSLIDFLQRQEP